jgi:hypothetical protein
MGSMHWRGSYWWLTWRDVAGEIHHESARTTDARQAQTMLAIKALPRAEAMVEQLEAIIRGETYHGRGKAERAPAKPCGAGRHRRKAAGNPGTRPRPQATEGGKS